MVLQDRTIREREHEVLLLVPGGRKGMARMAWHGRSRGTRCVSALARRREARIRVRGTPWLLHSPAKLNTYPDP